MEEETVKKEGLVTTEVTEVVVVSTVETTGVEAADAPVTAKSTMERVREKMQELCSAVKKVDRTTKTFVVVFVLFGLVVLAANVFRGVYVAAIVNGNAVTRLSVVRELEKQDGKNVLESMITKQLIDAELKKQKIVVPASVVDDELKKIEQNVVAQGGTLEMALAAQGMTLDDLQEQIRLNKGLEQVLADKITVSDEEVAAYLSTARMPAGSNASTEEMRDQAKEALRSEKLGTAARQWLSDVRARSTIEYFGTYQE